MKLIRKKQNQTIIRSEELAVRIARSIINRQQRIADFLNAKTQHLSSKSKLFLLILFCVLFSTINCYLITQSLIQ